MSCSSSLFRFKNVIFEISPSEAVGVFDVKAKFMGVHLETLQIEYQVVFLSPRPFQESPPSFLTVSCKQILVVWSETPTWFSDLLPGVLSLSLGQDLLQLQYEGVAVMKLFDRATINVNLLIFLLNKKFYEK